MLSGVKAMETPLLRQIEKFGKILTIIILIVCAITYAYGRLFLDIGFVDMFKAVVGVAVSAIPEGLPAIVTITLAIGVQRMAGRHAIIRRLPPSKPSDRSRGFVPTKPARLRAMKWWSSP